MHATTISQEHPILVRKSLDLFRQRGFDNSYELLIREKLHEHPIQMEKMLESLD